MANELQGVAELTRKLNKLDADLRVKTFRSVLFKSTTPVIRQMRARAPAGTKAHRTYRGLLVTPGYLGRSIKRLTGKKHLSKGRLSVAIGTKKEAWYGFLYDQGPYTITRRRQQTNTKARGHVGMRRRHIRVKPYTLKRRSWFVDVFTANESAMLSSIRNNLKQKVEALSRNG